MVWNDAVARELTRALRDRILKPCISLEYLRDLPKVESTLDPGAQTTLGDKYLRGIATKGLSQVTSVTQTSPCLEILTGRM